MRILRMVLARRMRTKMLVSFRLTFASSCAYDCKDVFFHELTYRSFLLVMQLTLLYSFTSPGLFVESCWHLFAGRAWRPQVAVRGPGRVTFLRCAAIAAAWSALSACPCM